MKHVAPISLSDDDPENEDGDEVFFQLEQLKPPEDLVNRVMQAVSHLPFPPMQEVSDEWTWYEGDLIVHHEHKRPS